MVSPLALGVSARPSVVINVVDDEIAIELPRGPGKAMCLGITPDGCSVAHAVRHRRTAFVEGPEFAKQDRAFVAVLQAATVLRSAPIRLSAAESEGCRADRNCQSTAHPDG
jgi:hypothetical protein